YRDLFGEDAFRNDQAGKTHIDRLFREDLNKICDGRGFPREHTAVARAACRNAAEVYYRAVVAFG
ncbi:phospholipase A2, partial [Streptomyces anulatus]